MQTFVAFSCIVWHFYLHCFCLLTPQGCTCHLSWCDCNKIRETVCTQRRWQQVSWWRSLIWTRTAKNKTFHEKYLIKGYASIDRSMPTAFLLLSASFFKYEQDIFVAQEFTDEKGITNDFVIVLYVQCGIALENILFYSTILTM